MEEQKRQVRVHFVPTKGAKDNVLSVMQSRNEEIDREIEESAINNMRITKRWGQIGKLGQPLISTVHFIPLLSLFLSLSVFPNPWLIAIAIAIVTFLLQKSPKTFMQQ